MSPNVENNHKFTQYTIDYLSVTQKKVVLTEQSIHGNDFNL